MSIIKKAEDAVYILEGSVSTIHRPTEIEAVGNIEKYAGREVKLTKEEEKIYYVERVLLIRLHVHPDYASYKLCDIFGISKKKCETILENISFKLEMQEKALTWY